MVQVIWLPEALADLDLIRAYVRQFDFAAAQRLVDRLADAGGSLADFPDRGRLAGNGRRELVTVPPYLLRYAVTSDAVYILGVRHSARRPD